jgi:phosphoglycerol transferase MdoB-like AlkP superfamily enzyme
MKEKFSLNNSYKYIFLSLSLIITFWLFSLYEIISKLSKGIKIESIGVTIVYKLLNDFWAGIGLGIVFLPLYLALLIYKKPLESKLINILFSLIIIVQFALIIYSCTTLINLGADILGYSFHDIYLTISAESLSLWYILPIIVLPLPYFGINYFFNKYSSEKQIITVFSTLILFLGGFKLLATSSSNSNYQNKLYFLISEISRVKKDKNDIAEANLVYKNEYPLLKPSSETKDVLAPFFEIHTEKPNIVVLVVEGLGAEFIGKNNYRGFTPYLDSMIPKSLYWENFVSNAGRTFGFEPSILGSLPFGENGFVELNPTPNHNSLISILKSNGYNTSFYVGYDTDFDRKSIFLEYSGIDNIIDINKFGKGYIETKNDSHGFSWGYPDDEMFRKTLSELNNSKLPRLDIIATQTNHEPFNFPSEEKYLKKVDSILNSNQLFEIDKSEIETYKNIFASLLYTDNSIKNFMQAYAKRPEYKNTIFIITGDHRLIPIEQKDVLSRFHVPLYIYSPMLKKTASFKSISSHWDITPSLVSFLMTNYKFKKIEKTAWMSQGLDTTRTFRNIHKIGLMRSKGSINDFIYKNFMYSEGDVYEIKEDFNINKINDDEIIKMVSDSLKEFKRLNAYLTLKNKIIPGSLIINKPKTNSSFSNEELLIIKKLTTGLNNNQVFQVARQLAFNKEHQKAFLLCNYILNKKPNSGDIRTLKGRILAWDGFYDKAELEFLDVIKRTPFYSDGYIALMDSYKWNKQNKKAIFIAKKGLSNNIKRPELSYKLAEAYKLTNNSNEAKKTIDSLLKIYPKNKTYLTFKKSLLK